MKVWIEHSYWDEYIVSLTEPQWKERWQTPHAFFFVVCEFALKQLKFSPLPIGLELCEFNLSGRKPKHVCTWVPA